MCGIAGFIDRSARISDPVAILGSMQAPLIQRGPDDRGIHFDAARRVGLAHCRLSIVDLSAQGRQPMASAIGRYRITYNGEIYNFPALRKELEREGCPIAGASDTAVMLAAFERWGIEAAVERFVGMFAFAAHDVEADRLVLGRDRLGIKPIYHGWIGGAGSGVFVFASDLRAIACVPGFEGTIDRGAVAAYLRFLYVPGPWTIYDGIAKVPPGHLVSVDLRDGTVKRHCWWDARAVAERGAADPIEHEQEAVERLDAALDEAVRLRLVSDVPLGAFLSGGIDSSTVVAMMQAHAGSPVRTFTIGVDDDRLDESAHARAVAAHLGTDHHELRVSGADALAVIPLLTDMQDEPFADSSQIPTFLVSRLARRDVKVALSGDGGDELFGGYYRHLHAERLWRAASRVPASLRRAAAALATSIPARSWDAVYGTVEALVPRRWRQPRPGERVHKAAEMALAASGDDAYRRLVSTWHDPASLLVDASEHPTAIDDPRACAKLPTLLQRMMFLDQATYLPDDLLVKLDRASMAVGLEARVPMIDHRVVELSWRIPSAFKVRDGVGKRVLRRVLARHVPEALVERPKAGFAVPLAEWLRGPLRPWAEELLAESRLRSDGLLRPQPVRREWTRLLAGAGNPHGMWAILMLQAWLGARRGGGHHREAP